MGSLWRDYGTVIISVSVLSNRPHQVKENLQSYMEHCQSKVGHHFFVDDIDLSLLCIKCMEVNFVLFS